MDAQTLIDKKRAFAETYFPAPRVREVQIVRCVRAPTQRDVDLGRRVREVRMARGYTQERLAAELQITFQQVQKYENGSNRISATRLAEIAECLSVQISALLEDAPISGQRPAADYLTPSEKSLLRAWRGMSPKNRRSVADIVTSLTTTSAACGAIDSGEDER